MMPNSEGSTAIYFMVVFTCILVLPFGNRYKQSLKLNLIWRSVLKMQHSLRKMVKKLRCVQRLQSRTY